MRVSRWNEPSKTSVFPFIGQPINNILIIIRKLLSCNNYLDILLYMIMYIYTYNNTYRKYIYLHCAKFDSSTWNFFLTNTIVISLTKIIDVSPFQMYFNFYKIRDWS